MGSLRDRARNWLASQLAVGERGGWSVLSKQLVVKFSPLLLLPILLSATHNLLVSQDFPDDQMARLSCCSVAVRLHHISRIISCE